MTQPTSDDKEKLSERMMLAAMHLLATFGISVTMPFVIKNWIAGSLAFGLVYLSIVILIFLCWTTGFLARNHKSALFNIMFCMWLGLSFAVLVEGGLSSNKFPLLIMIGPVTVLTGAVILGSAIIVLSIGTIALAYVLSSAGFLPTVEPVSREYQAWSMVVGIVVLSAVAYITSYWRNLLDNALREAQLLSQKAAVNKHRFLLNLNHELRNPLTALLSASQALQDGDGSEQQRESFNRTIAASSSHLIALLSDVLDVERLESSRIKLSNEAFSVVDLLNDIAAIFSAQAIASGCTIEVKIQPELHPDWLGPKVRINQILMNLVANAIKHNENCAILLTAEHTTTGITLTVQDTGKGIPEETLATMFSPFNSGQDVVGNAGLGLYIVKMLVEDYMRGSLSVISKVDSGSTFTINLPLEQASIKRVIKAPPIPAGQKLSVLVVDDNTSVLENIQLSFECGGIATHMAESPESAIEMLSTSRYDAVVTDLNFGKTSKTDGISFTKYLSNSFSCPVIGFTGNIDNRVTQEWLAAGAFAVFIKPYPTSELIKAIKSAVYGPGGQPII